MGKVDIDLAELNTIFQTFKQTDFEKKTELRLIRTEVQPTEVYYLEAEDAVKSEIANLVFSQFKSKSYQDRPIVEYDPVSEAQKTHQVILTNTYEAIEKAKDKIESEKETSYTTSKLSEKTSLIIWLSLILMVYGIVLLVVSQL